MKTKFNPPTKNHSITIVFETRDEMEEFYAIFDYTPITSTIGHTNAEQIRSSIGVNNSSVLKRRKLVENIEKFIKENT